MYMLSAVELNSLFKDLSGGVAAKSRAVGSIYSKLSPILFKKMRYRYRALSESDVHDILQDAFLKIYSSKSLPKSAEAIPSWVFVIVENAALDLFRKAYKKNELNWPQDSEGNSLEEIDVADQACSIASSHLNREVEDCVSKGMAKFSRLHPERELAISMSLDGSSIAEIAGVFRRTDAAMKQYIYESKKKLAPFIEHCIGELA